MISAHIEVNDFGRQMRISLIEYQSTEDGYAGSMQAFALTPAPDGQVGVVKTPLKEGQRVPDAAALLTLSSYSGLGPEICRALVVALAAAGYIQNPSSLPVSSLEKHLADIKNENSKKDVLLNKLIDSVTKVIGKKGA